jgi:hypothetical protein
METIMTKAGEYTLYLGSDAPRKPEEHEPDKWYFEPEDYVGFAIFSDPYETLDEARQAAFETGEREEILNNDIGGGG